MVICFTKIESKIQKPLNLFDCGFLVKKKLIDDKINSVTGLSPKVVPCLFIIHDSSNQKDDIYCILLSRGMTVPSIEFVLNTKTEFS